MGFSLGVSFLGGLVFGPEDILLFGETHRPYCNFPPSPDVEAGVGHRQLVGLIGGPSCGQNEERCSLSSQKEGRSTKENLAKNTKKKP